MLAAGLPLLLEGCAGYDAGFAALPASAGWQRLPLKGWLMNAGLGPARIAYCPPSSCAHPAVVATLAARGAEAARLLRSLASPAALLRPRAPAEGSLAARVKRPARKTAAKSTEEAWPIEADGLEGYRVTLSPKVAGGHPAYAVVLAWRSGDEARAALAVATDPDAALRDAKAAARSF
jgi:hypothetical protein